MLSLGVGFVCWIGGVGRRGRERGQHLLVEALVLAERAAHVQENVERERGPEAVAGGFWVVDVGRGQHALNHGQQIVALCV